ncbi:MAG: TolC family protein [Sulfurimonas sp.]|nr:TolC family protein [Sulfurimonas sp.]
MKTQLIKYSLILLTTLSLDAGTHLTLDDLILKALENAPDLKISTGNFEASKSRVNAADANYLPRVNLHLSAGKNARTNVPAQEMISDNLLLGNLSLKQILYDFGKTNSNSKSFQYESDALFELNKKNVSDKIRDVKFAYYTVLQALALINVQKENVKLNEAQLYRATRYFEAGIRTKIDISDAKVELIKAKLDLKTAQYDLKLAYASLDEVIGFKAIVNDYTVYSQDLVLESLFDSIGDYTLNLEDSINHAYENRNDLKSDSFRVEQSKAQKSLAKSAYYPELYFGADYTKQRVEKFQSSIPKDQWSASVNLDWNIYEGGATDAIAEEKRIALEVSKFAYSKASLVIKKETTEAYLNVYKAKDTVELSQSLVEVSDEKFNQASKRYEHGLSDYIELQQSRQGYIDAKASLVVNYYNYYQAIAYLDNAIGR